MANLLGGNYGSSFLQQAQNYMQRYRPRWLCQRCSSSSVAANVIWSNAGGAIVAPNNPAPVDDPDFVQEGCIPPDGVGRLIRREETNDFIGHDGSVWERDLRRCGYRRVTSLAWLDRRVNEMRVKL